MNVVNNRKSRLAIAVSILLAAPVNAWSQDDVQSGSGVRMIDEMIVTAQRRSESLSEVPVSLSALSAEALATRAITSERDLQTSVPGLLVRATQNSNQLNYSIRGQSVDAFTGSQPGVLPYFNEVQVNSYSASSFYDLESVQVLKGPQGTLFGRNSTGGAVMLTSVEPGNQLGGYVTARAGSYGMRGFEGAINTPIVSDTVLLRLAGSSLDRDGFVDNTLTGDDVGDRRDRAARATLLLQPIDTLTNSLVVDYSDAKGSSSPAIGYSLVPGTGAFLFSPALDLLAGPGAWDAYLAAHPGADPGGLAAFIERSRKGGPFEDVSLNAERLSHRAYSTVVINTTTYDITDDVQLKNIIGYSHAKSVDHTDVDGTPFGLENTGPDGFVRDNDTVSEELQIAGTALSGDLEYIAGLYYLNSENEDLTSVSFFDVSPIIPETAVTYRNRLEDEAAAVYSQGTYDLSNSTGIDGLGVTVGMRYTREEITMTHLPGSVFYNFPGLSNKNSDKVNKLSWQAGVQQQMTDALLVYFVTRTSFRSGGFNAFTVPRPGTAAEGGNGFDPEEAQDFEVGAKYSGLVGNVPTQINLALYHQTVDDIQRSIYIDAAQNGQLSAFTANIPEATIKGAEFDALISPVEWLSLGLTAAFTDAEFSKPSTTVFGQDKTYGPYSDTPEFSGSIYAQTSHTLAISELYSRVEAYHQSHFYFGSLNDTTVPGTDLDGYTLVNLRVGLRDIMGSGFSLAAHLKNAFDEEYYVGGLPTGEVLSSNSAVPGEPRTVFIEAGYTF